MIWAQPAAFIVDLAGLAASQTRFDADQNRRPFTLYNCRCFRSRQLTGSAMTEKHWGIIAAAGALTVAAALPLSATAGDVRRVAFPVSLLGTWAENPDQCGTKDKSNVVIDNAQYGDGTGTCAVRWIIETPGSLGANYAVHAVCTSATDPSKTQMVNIIIRPGADGRATMGRSFNALKTYQRCPMS